MRETEFKHFAEGRENLAVLEFGESWERGHPGFLFEKWATDFPFLWPERKFQDENVVPERLQIKSLGSFKK